MISIKDIYTVLVAMVPLYAAMILAYGSVRWWRIFTPVQCSGINRFVAVFAVPLLSFNFISKNNPYKMDFPFILADTISKLVIFLALLAWARFSRNGSLDWLITLFSLATLPNTLVMGIPLLEAMYGSVYSGLMVQLVVLQCIIWYTLMLFLFEYRAASLLVMQHFPDTAASIISFKIDSDVMSLDGREPVQTEADVGEDGKICVTIRRSISSRSQAFNCIASPRRSLGSTSMLSSKAITPRASNLTGADMYSIQSSRNQLPRDFNISTSELQSFMSTGAVSPRNSNFTSSDAYSVQSSRGPTPRVSNVYEDSYREIYAAARVLDSPCPQTPAFVSSGHPFNQKRQGGSGNALHDTHGLMQCGHGWNNYSGSNAGMNSPKNSLVSKNALDSRISTRLEDDAKGLHMYVWSSTDSPVSEAGLNVFGKGNFRRVEKYKGVNEHKEVKMLVVSPADQTPNGEPINEQLVPAEAISVSFTGEDFSSGNRKMFPEDTGSSMEKHSQGISKSSTVVQYLKDSSCSKPKELPPTMVMLKLILRMVGRKLLRNPNTYSSLIGLVWALVAFRWNISMPKIVIGSIKILSDAGLGMAMFSLGLFMALQPRLIACGTSLAVCAMAVRFLTGPAVMAASSIAVGLRGVDLHAAIVQAALPQGIVPFVFAREYDLHPDILSTAVIFGMLIALPITLLYYVLLGL